jgi:uncharacterized protein
MRMGVAAGVLLLAGCASSVPLRFYTLNEVPPSDVAATSSGAPAIRVGRVRIPAELDRNEIVQRIDANRLRIGEQDRWAAPLDEMIRRVLSANLLARTSTQESATVSVDIAELMGDTACAVTLKASWETKAASAGTADSAAHDGGSASAEAQRVPARAASGHEVIRIAPPAGSTCSVAALPQQMSLALAELTDRILGARR